jgi:hypothetical protein
MPIAADLLLGFIPPLVTGPLAGLVFARLLQRGKGWHHVLFWALLVVLNLLAIFWLASTSNEWFSVSSLATCLFTPAAGVLTLLVMRIAWLRMIAAGQLDTSRRGHFVAGALLISGLQVGMLIVFAILAPMLCGMGLYTCSDW